jgi:hypothetical protein
MKKKDKPQRAESAIQFDSIYREHHDPQTKEKRKIIENRKKRVENSKEDLGI